MASMSYADVLKLALEDKDMIQALVELIDQHKSWGAFQVPRIPSYVIVNIVDALRREAEKNSVIEEVSQ